MTTTAAYVVRQSQGDDDSMSLRQQREEVGALARDLADDAECFDLGVHTGFSTLSRGPDETTVEDHPAMERLLDGLRAGAYDYLVAYDDTRLARDGFLQVVAHAAETGGCVLRFVADVQLGDLAGDVRRVVEREVKQNEIRKARAAFEQWADESEHVGRPPYGLQYGPDKRTLVPGDDFSAVCSALDMLDAGATYQQIETATGVPKSTVGRLTDRRELYESLR